MRFHLIDRIDSWDPELRLVGRKSTSHAEEFWEPTPAGPVMPRPLVLEALCQAGTWLIMLSSDHRKRAALLSVGEVMHHSDVRPGEVLLLDARITAISQEAAILDGTVGVADRSGTRPVLTGTGIMCALIDAEKLDDPADTRRMAEQLLRIEVAR